MGEELRKSLSWEVSLHQEHLNKRVEAGGRGVVVNGLGLRIKAL